MKKSKYQTVYPKEYREELVKRMLPPESINPKDLEEESGVSITSLKRWLKEANTEENIVPKKEEVEWIPLNCVSNETKEETSKKVEPIQVKIGQAIIEIKAEFDRELLLDVMRVVAKI
jgi:hypothetical protein